MAKKLKNKTIKFFTDKYATTLCGKILSQLRDYANSNRFLKVNGHDGEIRHFQGARCILAERGPLKFTLHSLTVTQDLSLILLVLLCEWWLFTLLLKHDLCYND